MEKVLAEKESWLGGYTWRSRFLLYVLFLLLRLFRKNSARFEPRVGEVPWKILLQSGRACIPSFSYQ